MSVEPGSLAGAIGGSAAGSLAYQAGQSTVTLASIISTLGARLHFWFEVDVSAESLASGSFVSLNDLGPGGYHLASAAGSRPVKGIGTGPLGKNCVSMQANTQRLWNSSINLAAGKNLLFISVTKEMGGGTTVPVLCRNADAENAGDLPYVAYSTATNFATAARCNGVAEESVTVTSPALNTSWNKRSTRYVAATPVVHKINDVAVTPAFTSVGLCHVVGNILIGHASLAGGSVYLFCCVENPSAAEETLINQYIFQQTGR